VDRGLPLPRKCDRLRLERERVHAVAILQPRIDSEIANNLSYIERGLEGREFFVGRNLTGADIQMLFVLEAAGSRLAPYPASVAYRDRMHARPAYKRGIERGGPYQLMSR